MSEVEVEMDGVVDDAVNGNVMCCCGDGRKDPAVVVGLRNPWPAWC